MDVQALSVALAAAAGTATVPATVGKLTSFPFTPDSVPVPCVFVAEFDVDFDLTMGRMDTLDFTLRVLVGRADDLSTASVLNGLFSGAGPGSLKTAIESERQSEADGKSLGGACDDYRVTRMQGMRWYQHNGISYLGGELKVKVIGGE